MKKILFLFLSVLIVSCQEVEKIPDFIFLNKTELAQSETGVVMTVKSSDSWTVAFDYPVDVEPWCTASPESGNGSNSSILIKFEPNNGTKERSAQVRVNFKSGTVKTETIVQKGKPEEVKPEVPTDLKSDEIYSWMELPDLKGKVTEGLAYIYHRTKIENKDVRSYAMLYDGVTRQALWVAYPLYQDCLGDAGRSDEWGFDPKIPQKYQQPLFKSYHSLYGISGYDRGHQLPSGDRTCSWSTNTQTFYFTNMTAQEYHLNQKLWGDLENQIRYNVRSVMTANDTCYIVTGPLLTTKEDPEMEYIKDADGVIVTAIPKAYFKVALKYDKVKNEYSSIGFYFENVNPGREKLVPGDARSVKEIEQLTGYEFFTNLPQSIRDKVLSQDNPKDWNIN